MRLFIITCLVFSLGFINLALAQEGTAPRSDRLMENPTQKQMNEARYFLGQCRLNDTLNKRHDCKCLSLQFLEKRVQKGDEVKSSQIMSELRNACLLGSEKEMSDLGYKDMSDVPDDIIEEAQLVQQKCLGDTLTRIYQDCDCIAGRFIEDRMREGPLTAAENIVARYQGMCTNTVGIAGHYYSKCMDKPKLIVPDKFVPKYYCECYGREVAKGYKNLTSKPVGDTNIVLMGQASGICGKKLQNDERALR